MGVKRLGGEGADPQIGSAKHTHKNKEITNIKHEAVKAVVFNKNLFEVGINNNKMILNKGKLSKIINILLVLINILFKFI